MIAIETILPSWKTITRCRRVYVQRDRWRPTDDSSSIESGSPRISRTSLVFMPSCRVPTAESVCSDTAVLASPTTRLRSEDSTAAFDPMRGFVSESMIPPGVGRSL
ncbi:MAG: hypothetical protein ACM3NW_08780 [Syntrophomonadaceae bacterium]